MPPEPLPWDRKDFFRDRKHDRSSDPLGPVARWRDSSLSASSSSSYGGGSRGNDFSPRWGFPSDFRRPTGHGKQGGWHVYPEDSPHGYPTSRYGDRFVDDEGFRPSGPRGDGRYGRVYRENRTSFGQREWRSHSWEANHHQNGPRNTPGRPHCMNDQKSPHCVNDQKSPHCVNDQKSPHCVNERVNDQKPPNCVNDQKPPNCVNDQKPSHFVNNQKPPHCVNDQKPPHCVNDQKSPHSVNNQKSPHCTNDQKSPHCMNDQKSVVESPMRSSHPHSEPGGQFQSKDQASKTSDVSGSGVGPKIDKENALGLLDWKPVKWSRSGSLTSWCSGFSHSSSTKSIAEESNDVKGDLPPKKGSPLQSPSRDMVTCPPSIIPSEDAISRKKPRLGWGMGLAKYERQKGDGPEENNSKSGNVTPSNVERTHSFTSNLVEKSPRIAGVSDCSSPATPSSVTCSSSQGLEEKAYGRTSDADVDPNSFSVSPMAPVPENQHEGLHFILEKLKLNSITDLSSLISELLQADEQCSLDYGFKRSSTVNKLLLWKDDISKSLEMTETEIDSLENELKLLKSDCVSNSPCLVSFDSLSVDCKNEPQEHLNVIQRPPPLEVVSSKDIVVRETRLCDDATASHSENKDQDVDSPGTATSKLMEPVSSRKRPAPDGWNLSFEKMSLIDAEKTRETSCQCDERTVLHDDCVPGSMWNLSLCNQIVDSACDSILASNKDSSTRASAILDKLLPDGTYCFGSMEANGGPTLPAELTITEKFLQRKRFEKFKEGALSLKYRVFHHLWKEDLRLLSLKNHRSKSQKKFDLSTRTTLNGIQKHRSSNRSRFSPAGTSSLVPMTEIVKFTSKMVSDSLLPKIHRNSLKMPSMILDEKERSVRFVSNNGLVEDPWAFEKERALINPWTNEEKEIFMDKLANLGKDFGKIASFLDHKTTADCVEFYYKNHKSDCFEKTKKKQGKPLSTTSTYLVTSGKKWSMEREMNAASLDILGAASVIAAQAEEAIEPSKSISGKSRNRKSKATDGTFEASSSYCFAEDERETAAADVLAGICGSLSSEAMSSCITSSVDPTEGNQDLKHQKVGSFGRRPLTPEVTQKIDNHDDDDAYSDESCGEMDPVDWTDSEKSLFVQAFSSYGKDFTMISQVIRTKSRDLCRVFFSKARKCLGLDSIPNVTVIHGSTVETDSIVCSDKSGSRMDEDLPHINQDVSIPEAIVTDTSIPEDNCSAEESDHRDKSGSRMDEDLPHINQDVSIPEAIVTDTSIPEDNCSAEESDHRDDGHQEDIFSGDFVQVDVITQDDTSMVEASIGNTNERSVSKLENEINVSSFVGLVGPREGDDSNPLEASVSTVNQSEPSQVARVFPFDLSLKPDVNGISPHKEGSKAKAQSFGDSFLMKCNHEQKNEGHTCSLETEKPVCRNGNVKLFGKILSTPSSTEIPTCSVEMNEKMVHDHNGLMGLENVPIRSYGYWDGTKIQTGFSSMPDSALLLAKYPAAFGNYTISSLSSSKAEQPPPLALIPEGGVPFTFDVKQKHDPFTEANRDKFERLPEGGDVVVGGISDPVAALKLHYATNGLIREESSWRSKGDVGR